ncbi:MAG: Uma2 family endonuclease [Bacteroidetes bacterium]|nr:MAG: Uma2 family endonuclease [Bacteroidota bacterium]
MEKMTLHLPKSIQVMFYDFCVANRDLPFKFELYEHQIIISMTGSETEIFNVAIIHALYSWNLLSKYGKVFGNGGAFTMPNGKILSPDAAAIALVRWAKIPLEDRKKFAPIEPDFVLEIRSQTDRIADLKKKMELWMSFGVLLAWLIDPIEEKIWVYKKNSATVCIENFDGKITGEDVLVGLEIDLKEVFLSVKL